jgi:hypothetical protein
MMILGAFGENYPLPEESAGRYVVPQLNLNYNETYQLKIITACWGSISVRHDSGKTNPAD